MSARRKKKKNRKDFCVRTQGSWCQKTKVTAEGGGEKKMNISMLPRTFLTGGNFGWMVATASSWSSKVSRGAAGFSFSRLADWGLWQSRSLFSKAQLKAVGPALAGLTLVHLQHLYQPATRILAGTEIKAILERGLVSNSTEKHFCFHHLKGIWPEMQHKDVSSSGYEKSVQWVEGQRCLPLLNVSSRFTDFQLHFGKRIEETELVTAAFAVDWLGHLNSFWAAKQHQPLFTFMKPQTKVQVAAQELTLEMASQWQTGPSQLTTERNTEDLQQRWLVWLDVVIAFLVWKQLSIKSSKISSAFHHGTNFHIWVINSVT